MNKRQKKKLCDTRTKRLMYITSLPIMKARQCGKTAMRIDLIRIAMDSTYREFKNLKKYVERINK